MTQLGIGGHHSPRMLKEEWLTPPGIIELLGGWKSFDLDPCAPIERPWPTACEHYTIVDNGLVKPWKGRVWCNPPYGGAQTVGPWMQRMADHNHGIALIFARTETDVFFETVWKRASGLLFIRGRLFFCHSNGERANNNSGAPSVLVAYGDADANVLQKCKIAGHFVRLKEV